MWRPEVIAEVAIAAVAALSYFVWGNNALAIGCVVSMALVAGVAILRNRRSERTSS